MGRISSLFWGTCFHGSFSLLFTKVIPTLSAVLKNFVNIRPPRFPPVTYFAFNVLCWGILEMAMAACTDFGSLFVCRFLLGGFEALLIPAVTLLIAMWYKPNEQPARNAIILNVIAPILNGLVAWAVGMKTQNEKLMKQWLTQTRVPRRRLPSLEDHLPDPRRIHYLLVPRSILLSVRSSPQNQSQISLKTNKTTPGQTTPLKQNGFPTAKNTC